MAGIVVVAVLFGLAGVASPAQAVVSVEIQIPKEFKDREAVIAKSDDLTSKYLANSRKSLAAPFLKYEAVGWSPQADGNDYLKSAMVHQLKKWWGEANVRVSDSKKAAPLPNKPAAAALKNAPAKLAAEGAKVIATPGPVFDGSASGEGTVPVVEGIYEKQTSAIAAKNKIETKAPAKAAGFQAKAVPAAAKTNLPTLDLSRIVYGEASAFRPLLKNGAGTATPDNYDPDSVAELAAAFKAIGVVADLNGGSNTAAPVVLSSSELEVPAVKYWWGKINEAVAGIDAKMRKEYQDKKCEHFVMGPAEDPSAAKKTPAKGIASSWPYDYSRKIEYVFGPFRKPAGKGDVPLGDDIYVFVYCGKI